ncbi:MAG TPA: CHAP domain-containing protein [Ktedonobacteraceae bacterium]|nr:CHAP domain-containing protein [Ktedonobacteraceae bacterium]
MPPLTFWQDIRNGRFVFQKVDRRFLAKLSGVIFLIILISIEIGPLIGHSAYAQITSINHTNASVDSTCHQTAFSPDGNPFALCPGPFPRGGNCVWWPWEMWHRLGYDLPRNWGNAADWVSDAERSGLPLGKTPRVGSIAVFPVGDGVWAFTAVGHVAFVTSVSPDGSTFNVTYQNYGDPTPMYVGQNYPVSLINEPRFQNGNLRFIYFPRLLDPNRFAQLPGIGSNDIAGINQANHQFNNFDGNTTNGNSDTTGSSTAPGNQIALGLPPTLSDQEFNADFTGIGLSDLLLYNRSQGTLKVLSFSDQLLRLKRMHAPRFVIDEILANQADRPPPQLFSLSDKLTPANGWGSSLDIHIGDFTGAGKSEILLYDRVTGKLQLISLTPRLTIEKHVVLPGYGPGWELYVGSLDGQHSSVFMYNRLVNAPPIQSSTPTPIPTPIGTTPPPGGGFTPTPGTTPSPNPSPNPSPTVSPSPKPSPTPSPSPKPSPTASVTPTPACGTPTPTPTPTDTAGFREHPCPTPTPHCLTPTTKECSTPTVYQGNAQLKPLVQPQDLFQGGPVDTDLSSVLAGQVPQVLVSNVIALNFDHNFNILHLKQYTLMDNAWEIYVGRFVNANQDALLLYDRMLGEIRFLSFDKNLNVTHYQPIHNVDPNWEIFSGDFIGAGRSQVLFYDPGTGAAQITILKSDLSFSSNQTFSGWATNQALYVGHFGAPTLSVMLYDPQAIQSTFLEFNSTLTVTHQVTMQSWDNHWQILIGSFLDRSRCLATHNCLTGDDILVLDRRTGQLEQFVFSFGNQYQVNDNRSQPFVRGSTRTLESLTSIDTSTFSLLTTLNTSIRGEELY